MTGVPGLAAVLCVAVGGAVGAVLRHLASRPPLGPVRGVLLVNVVGAAALGVLVGLSGVLAPWLFLLLGTGLCGALTTWSTLAVHTWQLGRRSPGRAAAYLGLTLALGVLAALLARAVTAALLGG
ncbi:fluoride efflux transporter FluC [Serinicoccus sediminis]|uniref:fluoride efflux transporter FluC n=1 Tax=Serinicoccus sediminis TaxID=2306021 RepID=UPI001EDFD374|nr:CrcB family protein [Serinicoccus sediminis]